MEPGERITITKENGQKLAAWIHGRKDNDTIIVQCHGFPSDSHGGQIDYAKEFAKAGLTAIRFDCGGCGESDGDNTSWSVDNFANDLKAVINHVKSLGFKTINFMGSSYGGAVGLKVAAEDNPFDKMVFRAPAPDLTDMPSEFNISEDEWKEKGFVEYSDERYDTPLKLPYAMMEDARKNIMFEPAKNVKAKTLIIHGNHDTIVPVEDSQKLAENIPECMLVILDGADHTLGIDEDYSQANALMVDFFLPEN